MTKWRAVRLGAVWTVCVLFVCMVVSLFYEPALYVVLVPGFWIQLAFAKLGFGFLAGGRSAGVVWNLALGLVMIWCVAGICAYVLGRKEDAGMSGDGQNL